MYNQLLIIDPAELQPVNHLHPRQTLLAALTRRHQAGWKIVMLSNQSRIADGERTLTEVLDYHQAAMVRYSSIIQESLFTTDHGNEMVVTRCGKAEIGIFNTQSELTKKIAKDFNAPITDSWFLPPNPGLLVACMALHKAVPETTVMIGTGPYDALARNNKIPLFHPQTFEQDLNLF